MSHYDEGLVSELQILREVDRLNLDARGSIPTTSEDRSRLFVTGRREVRTTSSTLRSMWWSRERVTNVTRHMRQGSHTPMGLKDGVVGEAFQRRLSSNMPACRLDGVVHLIFFSMLGLRQH